VRSRLDLKGLCVKEAAGSIPWGSKPLVKALTKMHSETQEKSTKPVAVNKHCGFENTSRSLHAL
jgi:hypothetical protein